MVELWQVKGLTGAIAVRRVNENICQIIKTTSDLYDPNGDLRNPGKTQGKPMKT